MIWSDFYGLIVPEVHDCPPPVIDAQLRRTAIEFFRTTQVWVAELETINTDLEVGTYDLISPVDGAMPCGISQLWLNDEQQVYIPFAQMSRYASYWPTEIGDPVGYTQLSETTVTLYKIPPASSEVKLLGVLRPSALSSGIPDWIGDKYFDELVAGTKARLMSMVGVAWSNPQGATLYGGIYKGDSIAVAQARATARATGQLSMSAGGDE